MTIVGSCDFNNKDPLLVMEN